MVTANAFYHIHTNFCASLTTGDMNLTGFGLQVLQCQVEVGRDSFPVGLSFHSRMQSVAAVFLLKKHCTSHADWRDICIQSLLERFVCLS